MFGAAFVAVLVVQIAVTDLLLTPSRSDPSASRKPEKKVPAESDADHSENDPGSREYSEVLLGEFSFSNRSAVPGLIIHVDFNLAAVVLRRQASTLESQAKYHRGRIREAVNAIVRNSTLEELNDPNLATLKRLIRQEINRLLDNRLVHEVVINDIRIMEQ
jgi:hypothetical protein